MTINDLWRPAWLPRDLASDTQTVYLSAFIRHYFYSFGEAPPGSIEGIIRGLLAGDVELRRERPLTWPLTAIVPILREAVREIDIRRSLGEF